MKTFILIFFIKFSVTAFGQGNKDSTSTRAVGVRLSYTYSKLQFIDGGICIGKIIPVREMIGIIGYRDAFANIGYGWTKNNTVMTAKVGYEFMTLLPGARISLLNVTDFKRNQIGVLPEIGLSYNSIFYVMYGYNFNLSGHNIFNAKGHQINLGLNFPLFVENGFIWNNKGKGKQ
ncbi:MAG: hypothetical protein J7604_07080 [Sporocytophaga sp.]|uniref:hypothetical protein n=1 Tax=Sporocytophaga sp. TaxID=2231183 RepID=UPI001B0D6E7C|nr:hypothetical protein [Sporocytophaga sp.]MBO9699956.1 hypothetical protein [Sporocytophaga sp.]